MAFGSTVNFLQCLKKKKEKKVASQGCKNTIDCLCGYFELTSIWSPVVRGFRYDDDDDDD